MIVIGAAWVCPVSSPPIRDGRVIVDSGRIVEVLDSSAAAPRVTDSFPGCAILPGLVNAHVHLELTVLRGFLENMTFPEWVRTLTRTKYERLSRHDLLWSARLGAIECLRAGVTAVGEVMDIGTGWEAMDEFGLRGVAYQEAFGPSPDQADGALEALSEKVESARERESATRRVGVSPHAPYSVSAELYRRVRDHASDRNLPVAVHIAESGDESRFVHDGAGPFADNWISRGITVTPRRTSPLRYLAELEVLGPRTQAIHAIHADASDIALLTETGTSVVHCPKSNLKLGHGIAPVRELLASGVPVGLGSDSVASNNNVDMFEEMRTAIFLQRTRSGDPREIGASQALRMATLDGARCLGMDAEFGSIDVGKRADFAVVDLNDPALTPTYDPVETVVFSASRKNIVATYLGGQRVQTEPSEAVAAIRAIARRLSER